MKVVKEFYLSETHLCFVTEKELIYYFDDDLNLIEKQITSEETIRSIPIQSLNSEDDPEFVNIFFANKKIISIVLLENSSQVIVVDLATEKQRHFEFNGLIYNPLLDEEGVILNFVNGDDNYLLNSLNIESGNNSTFNLQDQIPRFNHSINKNIITTTKDSSSNLTSFNLKSNQINWDREILSIGGDNGLVTENYWININQIIVLIEDFMLASFDINNGNLLWKQRLTFESPTVGLDNSTGKLFCISNKDYFCINAQGSVENKFDISNIYKQLDIHVAGFTNLIFNSDEFYTCHCDEDLSQVICINKVDGVLKNSTKINELVVSEIQIDKDSKELYLLGESGKLHVISFS